MSKDQTKDLLQFLKPFEPEIIERVMWLRAFVWDLYPKSNELIYDNYNALAFGWSPTDRVGHIFCNIAVGRTSKNVHFGFYWGSEIADPKKILLGGGSQYRYILVKDQKSFPKTYIKALLRDAYQNSVKKIKDPKQIMQGKTIVKSISEKKREKKVKDQAGLKKPTDFLSQVSAPARRALEGKGIKTEKQLSRYTEAEILDLHGIGPSAIPILRKSLEAKGLSFRKKEKPVSKKKSV